MTRAGLPGPAPCWPGAQPGELPARSLPPPATLQVARSLRPSCFGPVSRPGFLNVTQTPGCRGCLSPPGSHSLPSCLQQQGHLLLWGLLPRGHLAHPQEAPAGLPGLRLATPVHNQGQGRSRQGLVPPCPPPGPLHLRPSRGCLSWSLPGEGRLKSLRWSWWP